RAGQVGQQVAGEAEVSEQDRRRRCDGDGVRRGQCRAGREKAARHVHGGLTGETNMQTNRAYSVLEIKTVDTDQRTISGIATTPEPDRVGDIVDPLGAKFAPEIPLLWQHKHDKPVGVAKLGKPTKD